uniref:BK channel n=1 Tax=Pelusios castaneus TaxID=367368 RepID=A0A8C8SCZ5_9SAUR
MCFSLTPSSCSDSAYFLFWLELNSIVDFFTIPPVCVSYYLKRHWLGLRFLRALRLLELPKILQFLKITKTSNSIKLSKLLAAFLSTWLTAAGFIHLVENTGDPWVNHQNSQYLSYFDCLYLIMVTMSTVGFGDVVTTTSLGRIFMIFFIIGGLVLFANFIPEIVDIVRSDQQYQEPYETVRGRKYIVVCGDITLESVTAFLSNFLAQDMGDICTEIVFLGETLPSLELETVFKCYSAYTTFFHGSVLNYEDLKRVAVRPFSFHPTFSFHESQVLSVKNHYPNTRVIIQIIQSHNKVYLSNIPSWDWRRGDSIICFAELKLGFIAQSCLVPGLSTLLRTLFIRKKSTMVSPSLVQITSRVFKSGQMNLDLFLHSTKCNPISSVLFLLPRAHFYCKACHSDINNPELIKKCHCRSKSRARSITGNILLRLGFTPSPLQGHIVVCVFGDANSTLIGLRNFVMPLRASNFTYKELKDIVFLGSLEYLKREWKFIQNFPKLIIFQGSALSCGDLRAVNIRCCTMCTILSSNLKASTNPTLVDTESILATLNIRAMQFKCSSTSGEATSNVQFIDQHISSDTHIPGQKLNLTPTISSGAIFSDSFLDSLLSTTYCNHHILALLQTLVTGGTSPELEEQLAEKNMLSGNFNNTAYVAPRARCKLALMSLSKSLLTDSQVSESVALGRFGSDLKLLQILCLGLYRLREEPNPYKNRGVCVIARPPSDFKILPTDLLFCVVPFSTSTTGDLSVREEDFSTSGHQSQMDSSIIVSMRPHQAYYRLAYVSNLGLEDLERASCDRLLDCKGCIYSDSLNCIEQRTFCLHKPLQQNRESKCPSIDKWLRINRIWSQQ